MKKEKYLAVVAYKGREERIVIAAESIADAENVLYERKKHHFDNDAVMGTNDMIIKNIRRMK